MREACRVTALVHKELEKNIRPGISTLELDKIAERVIRENGGIPAQKGYNPGVKGVPPFPASICTSINDEVIHGVPSSRVKLKEGDVVSIDLVVLKDGFNGDAARTYIVGKGSKQAYDLLNVTEQAFFEGIKYAVKGNRIGDVSNAVIRDRKIMANDGIIVVIANIDTKAGKLLGKINITTRGFVLVNENEALLKDLETVSKKAINSKINGPINYTEIKSEIINSLSSYTYKKTGRKPIILPVIMDIKR